jgi:hypothetical protein
VQDRRAVHAGMLTEHRDAAIVPPLVEDAQALDINVTA